MSEAAPRISKKTSRSFLHGAQSGKSITRGYSVYIVFMLAVVGMLNQADAFVFSILLDPIQQDLQVSNTAMGVLAGAAYSLVFATAGLPLARVADLSNRRNLIAVAVAVWSAATAACGAVAGFAQMFAARVGVAIAESAFQPSFVSMVGDLFAPARRGIAIAFVMIGGAAGIAVGGIVAGVVAHAYSWRLAFVALGLPGILFALLFWLTVPEPVRGAKDGGVKDDPDTATMLRALRYLACVPTAWRLILASLLLLFTQAGWRVWVPTFFLRVHDLSLIEMSTMFGLFMGGSAILSMIVSGFISDWLARRGERLRICFIGAAILVGIPFVTLAILVENVWLAWALIVIFNLVVGGAPPAVSAAGISVIRPRARALWTSLYNLAGYGLGGVFGPVVVGFLSDQLADEFGKEALRYSLLVVPAILLVSAFTYFWASTSANHDAGLIRQAS